jgi:hypothetical protein
VCVCGGGGAGGGGRRSLVTFMGTFQACSSAVSVVLDQEVRS